MTGRDTVQAWGTRSRTTDGAVCALAKADQAGIAFTDVADAVGLIIVILAHFVSVIEITATGPGGATTKAARCAGAADSAALFQGLALEVAGGMRRGDMARLLIASSGCCDTL